MSWPRFVGFSKIVLHNFVIVIVTKLSPVIANPFL